MMTLKLSDKSKTRLINGILLVFLIIIISAILVEVSLIQPPLEGKSLSYVRGEYKSTDLDSRKWMAKVIKLVRQNDLSPPEGARVMAYTASIYSDVLEATSSEGQANTATAELVKNLLPEDSSDIDNFLKNINESPASLNNTSSNILERFLTRLENDNSELTWDQEVPEGKGWFIRGNEEDKSAMAGKWKTWLIDKENIRLPPDPQLSGVKLSLAKERVKNFVDRRTPPDEIGVFFWQGIDDFYKSYNQRSSITLAGIWQNIFFVEAGEKMSNKKYAKHQKALAQTLADSFIMTWKTKYEHFSPRPSMQIPNLDFLVPDPPYPGYVSEHASVSRSAAVLLSNLLPDKSHVWQKWAENSSNSRLLSGNNFLSDVREGEFLGRKVAIEAANNLSMVDTGLSQDSIQYEQPNRLETLVQLAGVMIDNYIESTTQLFADLFKEKPAFVERSEEANLSQYYNYNTGAAWGDYNNDGYLDLMTTAGLFKNTGDGDFVKAKVNPNIRMPGMFGDYNNDGCLDVFAIRSGPKKTLHAKGRTDRLFKNNCNGDFVDVTHEAGIHDTYHGVSASWTDYNNDGYLDIYVGNNGVLKGGFAESANEGTPFKFEPNVLWRNNGDGTFTNVTKKAGVVGLLDCPSPRKQKFGQEYKFKFPFQPAWLDYDNDNDQDLFIVMDTLVSAFYENNGDGTFTQKTEEAGLCAEGNWSNMGAGIGDYNNDGYLDIYVTNAAENFLWVNNGDGTFTNKAPKAGVQEMGYGWGTESIDYNNDGWQDIIMVNGHNRVPATAYHYKGLAYSDLNKLFKNQGDGTFVSVGKEEGVTGMNEVNFSVAVGDYNNDGFEDMFIPAARRKQVDSHPMLFKNRPNGNNWIQLQLIGRESNRMAVGTRIKVVTEATSQIKEINAGSGFKSQASPWPTFGLGQSEEIEKMKISWPSGNTQEFENIENLNRRIVIREGDSKFYGEDRWVPDKPTTNNQR